MEKNFVNCISSNGQLEFNFKEDKLFDVTIKKLVKFWFIIRHAKSV